MAHGDRPGRRATTCRSLRVLGSTGEPWNEDPWRWYFDVVGGGRCPVINISGGTEVGACFLSPHPVQPTHADDRSAARRSAWPVDVFDDDGKPVRGEVGELVCTEPVAGHDPGAVEGDPSATSRRTGTGGPTCGCTATGRRSTTTASGSCTAAATTPSRWPASGSARPRWSRRSCRHPAVRGGGGGRRARRGEGRGAVGASSCWRRASTPDDALRAELADLVAEHLGRSFRPSVVRFTTALPKTRSAKVVRRAIRAAVTGAGPGRPVLARGPGCPRRGAGGS